MTLWLAFVALLFAQSIPFPGFIPKAASFAPTCHTQMGGNGALQSTPDVNCTGAGLFVITQAGFSAIPLPVPTDSQSNSYTSLTPTSTGSFQNLIRYVLSPTTSAAMHWNLAMGGTFAQIEIVGFPASAPVFVTNTGAAAFQPGSITPTGSTLFVTGYSSGGAGTVPSVNSGFTITDSVGLNSGVNLAGASAWKKSASAENPTWAEAGAANQTAVMATFTGVP
jgi:hypothetical protein